jgi:maltose alpha-D-glucosyltransferase/alpha-amylase
LDERNRLSQIPYAANIASRSEIDHGTVSTDQSSKIWQWRQFWKYWVSAVFLNSYLHVAAQDDFLPKSSEELRVLFDYYFLERSIYDLGYELNSNIDQVDIALQRILELHNALS